MDSLVAVAWAVLAVGSMAKHNPATAASHTTAQAVNRKAMLQNLLFPTGATSSNRDHEAKTTDSVAYQDSSATGDVQVWPRIGVA
ncbi:MAG TPA: hypothetical protein VHE81_01385 [Lacipirellulaceae bacterium]|nr:hypothetical protein [Lacipirellulaceae bacterium]